MLWSLREVKLNILTMVSSSPFPGCEERERESEMIQGNSIKQILQLYLAWAVQRMHSKQSTDEQK